MKSSLNEILQLMHKNMKEETKLLLELGLDSRRESITFYDKFQALLKNKKLGFTPKQRQEIFKAAKMAEGVKNE